MAEIKAFTSIRNCSQQGIEYIIIILKAGIIICCIYKVIIYLREVLFAKVTNQRVSV